MAVKKEIGLGNRVEDITNGFVGIATTRSTFLTGNVQFGVQPEVDSKKPGVYPEAISIDSAQLKYVDDGVVKSVTPAPADTGIELGNDVEDIVGKFSGIAVRRTDFMNGCVYYSVQSAMTKDGTSKEDFIEYKRLKVVGKGVTTTIKRRLADQANQRPAGGPITRIPQRG
jgi:hypothetical protein